MLLLDKIIWGILAIFFLSGWLRGFLRSLIGPIAFFCCFIAAIIFYDINRNILMTSVILFAGTIALGLSLSVVLTLTIASINKEYRGKVFLLSRILGSGMNLLWQSNILFISIILFSVTPINHGIANKLQHQIPISTMMTFYKTHVVNHFTHYQAFVASVEILGRPDEVSRIAQTEEFNAFLQHPKTQAFINDPKIIAAAQKNDSLEILKSASLRTLVTDDSSMHLLTDVIEKVYADKLSLFNGNTSPKTTP